MRSYSLALSQQKEKETHFLKDVGDQWRTPDALFWGINAMFGPMILDLFTDGENTKCPHFYTVEDNALSKDWSAHLKELNGAAFGNPPYSRARRREGQQITGMSHILNHTFKMREKGGRYVFLIKAATSEVWWPEKADHIAFIRGRIGFELPAWFVPANDRQIPSGAFFAGAIAVFDKKWRGPAFSYIDREELLRQGAIFQSQIHTKPNKLQASAKPQNAPEIIPVLETANLGWSEEVDRLFDKLSMASELNLQLQYKLRLYINRLKNDGFKPTEILSTAQILARKMGATV